MDDSGKHKVSKIWESAWGAQAELGRSLYLFFDSCSSWLGKLSNFPVSPQQWSQAHPHHTKSAAKVPLWASTPKEVASGLCCTAICTVPTALSMTEWISGIALRTCTSYNHRAEFSLPTYNLGIMQIILWLQITLAAWLL